MRNRHDHPDRLALRKYEPEVRRRKAAHRRGPVDEPFVGQVDRSDKICQQITKVLDRPRPGALDETATIPAREQFDPTLGGLVEVER